LPEGWIEGLEILRQRQRNLPKTVIRALTAPLDVSGIDLRNYRTILTTGIGSSEAHSRYLSWLLQTYCSVHSRHVSTGAFIRSPQRDEDKVLIVFSQGLSPNARLPLSWIDRFGATILVTAAGGETGERAAALQRVKDAGAIIVPMPVDPEYEVLLRLSGPAAGYAVALRIAAHCGSGIEADPNRIASAMQDAISRAEGRLSGAASRVFSDPVTFITTHGYGELAANLAAKVVEGMFLPAPPIVDAFEFAHGPMQEAAGKNRTFIALSQQFPLESSLFATVRATMEPQHQWLELDVRLPEPFHIFEHESAMNAFVLNAIVKRRLDQREWPGKGRDRALYSIASPQDLNQSGAPESGLALRRSRRMEDLTWPEIEERINAGERTVVLPLGAVEQHGPHMPLNVDTIIADALAERFCSRVRGALQAPTLHVGCSNEHMGFCGTISLQSVTLFGAIKDTVSSLVHHGFTHVVVFSAHGGNDGLLAAAEAELKIVAAPARVTVVHGIERLSKTWSDASAIEGITLEMSGAHAGEFETSIIAGLRPDIVRWEQIRAGTTSIPENVQDIFYPNLRTHASEGVVGDPRAALAERADRYLDAWVDVLVAEFRRTVEE
jgi:creatinine amidohydrolase